MSDEILKKLNLDYGAFHLTQDEFEAIEAAFEADEQYLKAEAQKKQSSIIEQTNADYDGVFKPTSFFMHFLQDQDKED